MTLLKRPFQRCLSLGLRSLGRAFFPRLVLVLAVFTFSASPTWSVVRAVVAACSSGAPETAPAESFEEEENQESAALHRHHVEIRRVAERKAEHAPVAGGLFRHRMEWDEAAVARRWSRYEAPPRAPPPRLLI